MNCCLRQGNASFEPELMDAAKDSQEDIVEAVHTEVAVCPLGHDCSCGCGDPERCSKW